MTLWPDYLIERARYRPPVGCLNAIVKGSTPVVSFGNPVRATVATIGLNPAGGEFLDCKDKLLSGSERRLLSGSERRLATLESLKIQSYCDIDKRLGAKIVDECAGYFDRKPYDDWFRPLDEILQDGARASYYPGVACPNTACHLDLSPWATSDGWSKLTDSIRMRLLRDGESFLCELLRRERYHLVIANGKTVKEEIEQAGLVTWAEMDPIEGEPSIKLYVAEGGSTRFLAWSCNLQWHIRSQPEHIPALISFVATYSGTRRAT